MAIVPTDYSDNSNWLSLPDVKLPVDVLYFYPTCYAPEGKDSPLICDIKDEKMRAKARRYANIQSSVFAKTANVFVPYYRQCDAFALVGATAEEIAKGYEAEPLADVLASIDYYFKNINNGRPFFIAGHSQGSVMVLYALSLYFGRHLDLYKRMIAAYVIGFGVTEKVLRENPHLKMAQGEDDIGVIVSYNTEGPENLSHKNVVVPEGSIAINPLNWRTDEVYASIELNKGSLYLSNSSGEFTIGKPLADAQINLQRGSVVCTTLKDLPQCRYRYVSTFGPESFHSMDYSLYYMNLQENIAKRAAKVL